MGNHTTAGGGWRRSAVIVLLALLSSGCAFVGRVGLDAENVPGELNGREPSVSADGRYIAFTSDATDLVDIEGLPRFGVFRRDVVEGTTTAVSLNPTGEQGNDHSGSAAISADGRYVAFLSFASDLVPGDTNAEIDAFVRDMATGTTTRVSVADDGTEGDGRAWERVAISADGRFVAFTSFATNLVAGDTNGIQDVFVRDLVARTTTRVNVDDQGGQSHGIAYNPAISADGRYISFDSAAFDPTPGEVDAWNVYVRDTVAGTTTLASVDTTGEKADRNTGISSISADGRYVAFESQAADLVVGDTNGVPDVFVRDLVAGVTTRISIADGGLQGDGRSGSPSISGDGRHVSFVSQAANLVPGDANDEVDVFVRDRLAGTTTRVSVDTWGGEADGRSASPSITADGRYVAFDSSATNLTPDDANDKLDVFLTTAVRPSITSVSPPAGSPGSTVTVTITGRGFVPAATVAIGGGVRLASVTYVSSTEIIADLEIAADAPPGGLGVSVVDPGALGPATGAVATCAGCFTIDGS